jgi:6-phosphogluconolactonase
MSEGARAGVAERSPEVLVGAKPALAEELARRVESAAALAISRRGTVSFALAGGSVAETFFPRLARLPLDWDLARFFWADERAVAPTDEQSNFRLARELWLAPARVPESSVRRMPADGADLDAAAVLYAAELMAVAGTPPTLDVALLGVGEDGHVASLFPGHPLLDEEEACVAAVRDASKPPSRRLTLTMPVLARARLVVAAAFGVQKAPVVAAAMTDRASTLPVARLLRTAARPLVLLDGTAASSLPSRFRSYAV